MESCRRKMQMALKLFLVLAMALNLTGCFMSDEDKEILEREKGKVEEYLQAKYGKEFVVTDAEYATKQLGDIWIEIIAHPKDDRKVNFRVTVSPIKKTGKDKFGEDYKENGHYDTYLYELWKKQGAGYEDTKELFDGIFDGKVTSFRVSVGPGVDFQRDYVFGYTPGYEEILREEPDKISFKVNAEMEKETVDIAAEAEKIFEFVEAVRRPKRGHYQLTFSYFDRTKINYRCAVWKEDIDLVKSVEDVEKEFKVIYKK